MLTNKGFKKCWSFVRGVVIALGSLRAVAGTFCPEESDGDVDNNWIPQNSQLDSTKEPNCLEHSERQIAKHNQAV